MYYDSILTHNPLRHITTVLFPSTFFCFVTRVTFRVRQDAIRSRQDIYSSSLAGSDPFHRCIRSDTTRSKRVCIWQGRTRNLPSVQRIIENLYQVAFPGFRKYLTLEHRSSLACQRKTPVPVFPQWRSVLLSENIY